MSSGLVLLLVLALPYLAFNLWRVARGRSWAISFCHLMKEWEQNERSRLAADRARKAAGHT